MLIDELDADVDEMFATADALEEHCIERFRTADKFDAEGFATVDKLDVSGPSLEMFPKHREPVHKYTPVRIWQMIRKVRGGG